MEYTKTKKWLCKDCDCEFTSTDERHHMDYCPKCKNNAVDHEEWYIRIIGNVEEIK